MIIAYCISGIVLSIIAAFLAIAGGLRKSGKVDVAGLIVPAWFLIGGVLILIGVK